jgi:hypothetical protein
MPLFESQQARTDRLFATAFLWARRRARSLHEAPWLDICEQILLAGSVAAALSIKYYKPLQTLWGRGDEEKAVALTKVFSLAALSAYLGPAEGSESGSSDERQDVLSDWAKAILELFEDDSPESLEHFLGVDRQCAYDRAEARPAPLSDVIYFSDAVVALGGRPAIKLTAADLPISNYTYEELERRGVIPDPSALPGYISRSAFSAGATACFASAIVHIERRLAEYYGGTPEAEGHVRRAEKIERALEQAERRRKELRDDLESMR